MARSSVVGKPDDGEGGIPDSRFERPQRRLMDSGPDSHQYSDPSEYRWVTGRPWWGSRLSLGV